MPFSEELFTQEFQKRKHRLQCILTLAKRISEEKRFLLD